MLNKIAILIITYNTQDLTQKLVNQINIYNKNLFDLTIIDNSEKNIGFDQAVISWLKEKKSLDYAGYWLLNNDISIDINKNYIEKFLEYINYDSEIGLISTKVIDTQPYGMPQKLDNSVPMLTKYVDFQSAVLTRTFVNNFTFDNTDYFFGGLDFDACIFANNNNMKILIDYRYSVNHKYHQSFIDGGPIEDMKKHLNKFSIDIDSTLDFDSINSQLMTKTLIKRYPFILERPFDTDVDKCTSLKHEYMNEPLVDYGQAEFNTGLSLYGYSTFDQSKIYFKRAMCAGKEETLGYLIGVGNYTFNFEDIADVLSPYVDRKGYDSIRAAYEYSRAQADSFTKNIKEIKTYVFYVKPDAGHPWDSEHTEEGIGGSEIAVINLSKELAKAGQNVLVFNNCHTPGIYDGVFWNHIDAFDAYEKLNNIDVLIVSRWPEFRFVKPRTQVYYWAHDLNYYERITPSNWQYFDKFLVLSRYHYRFFSEAYPWIPKDRFDILANGLDLKRFNQNIRRNPKKLIYSSNPDRGLVVLFDIFEELHKWDPELELHVFGYYPDNIRKHPSYWREVPGVIYRGYHKQYELAAEYMSSKLWLYPCTWLETFCITALEAQAAGTPSVVSEWGPLRDRVGNAGIVIDGFNKDEDHKQRFVEAIKKLLTDEELWNKYSKAGIEQVKHSTWTNTAQRLMEISNKWRY
jgi:glycosyltransferase involved in cell wall biosynthesis